MSSDTARTRPLTAADRWPQLGDWLYTRDGATRFVVGNGLTGGTRLVPARMGDGEKADTVYILTGDILIRSLVPEYPATDVLYSQREDGGPVTMEEQE